jgi:hypothetical protein
VTVFTRKKEIYLGYLNAMHEGDIHPSLENAKKCGLWHNRCKLFGSKRVSNAMQMMLETNDDKIGRDKAVVELYNAMREDLSR